MWALPRRPNCLATRTKPESITARWSRSPPMQTRPAPMSVTRVPSWRRSREPSAFAKGNVLRALFLAITVSALGAPAHAQSRQVIGYAGVLGEWELSADVTEARSGELSGPATMTHVGLCTQDGPEKKTGDIRLQTSASRLSARLSLAGMECTYDAKLSEAYKGQMTCPDRPPMPLTLWLR